MKKILSNIVAALVAVFFSAIVSASNVPTSAPATEMSKPEVKSVKKHHKHQKKQHRHQKNHKVAKKESAPAAPIVLEAGRAVATPEGQ